MAIALSGSLILSGSITVSGSIISTGTISMSGSIASASYALNATSASYANNATTASYALNATTGAYANTATSASYALNTTTFNGLASSIFATTGSNTFIGNQVVSGSLTTSGSITATGTITAQTLVVQTVTSSTVYSSGSNIFGNAIGNTQTFTGSVFITGSTTLNGALTADTVGFIGVIPTYTNNYISFSHTCRSGAGDYSFLSGYDGSTIINAKTGYAIDLRTNNVTKLTINPSGSVGINTDILTVSGLAGNVLYLRPSSSNIGQTAIAIQDYRKCTRWAINGQDGVDNFNFAIYSTPNNTNDYSRRFTINQEGNIGIGVVPCTWRNTFTALQVGTAALTTNVNAYGYFSSNFYNDVAGVDRYMTSGKAGVIAISNGEIIFYNTDASCAAGCVLGSCERMRITSTGNVGVGLSNPVEGMDVQMALRIRCNTPNFTAACNSLVIDYVNTCIFGSSPTARYYSIGCTGVSAGHQFLVGVPASGYTALNINGNGIITRQCQPYFYADTLTGTSLAGNCTPIWINLRASQNTGYSTSTGRFTAPVTGVYSFSWVYLYAGITNPSGCIDDGFSLNGTQIYSGNRYRICQRSWGDQYVAVQGSVIVRLTANDYFSVLTANTGDSGLVGYGGSTWGYFTGALI